MKTKERKNLQNEYASENIDFFFNLLDTKFKPEFNKGYIKEIKRLSEGFNIRLTREQKLKFCKKCLAVWDVKTREIRFNPKTRTKEYICKLCGFVRRYKY